ncbi:MAG: FAD-binding protein [Pseudomonadota bacterium]
MTSVSDYEFTANVEPPLVLSEPGDGDWTDEADIVVVGFGGAGVVASLQALEAGASVIALDRFEGGGATERSGGVVYAGGTKYQREAGYDDSAEEMYKYLSFEGVPVQPATLRRFCEASKDDIDWVESFGVEFGSTCFEDRVAYPPDDFFLYYTGMEKFRGDVAKIAPRGHRTKGKGATGKNYFGPLKHAALEKGVTLKTHSPVRRLILNDEGRVIGVEVQEVPDDEKAKHQDLFKRVDPYKPLNGAKSEIAIAECAEFEASVEDVRKRYRARRAVILATGGYNYNIELFARYRPVVKKAYKELVRGGSMGCDGSGIELGVSAGGGLSHMDRLFCTKAISPPHQFIEGVLVNRQGERFIAEDAYVGNVGCAVSEQDQDGEAWLILDSNTFWTGVRQAIWPVSNMVSWWGMPVILNLLFGGTKRASSLQLLARKLSIDPVGLEKTFTEYNAAAAETSDPRHGKLAQHISVQDKAPYYAYNLSFRNKWGFSGTMPYGGLVVDEDSGEVQTTAGENIKGLYAAGRTAVGVCSEANFSGLSIADTIFSGRRAARAALQRNA